MSDKRRADERRVERLRMDMLFTVQYSVLLRFSDVKKPIEYTCWVSIEKLNL